MVDNGIFIPTFKLSTINAAMAAQSELLTRCMAAITAPKHVGHGDCVSFELDMRYLQSYLSAPILVQNLDKGEKSVTAG